MAPSQILWSPSPIVADQTETYDPVGANLTVEVAEKTLGLIEEVLESSRTTVKRVKTSVRKRDTMIDMIKRKSFGALRFAAFSVLLILGAVDIISELTEYALSFAVYQLMSENTFICM
jgi:hypothetical protein